MMKFIWEFSMIYLTCLTTQGAFGSPMYKINLLAKVKDANIIRVTNGPKSTTRSSNKAYSFGNSTVDQLVTGDNFLTAIKGFNDNGYNEDITLSVIFKLNSEAIGKTNSIMSFTSATTDKNYLSIGLRSQENYANIVEGMDTGSPVKHHEMYVDIDYHSKNQDFTETVLLRDKITFNNWTTLIMRVQSKANLSVSVNCHPVVIKQLAGRFPVIPSDSEFRIIQSIEKNIWTMTKEVGDIFQGDIIEAKLLFGKNAFKCFSPCGICQELVTGTNILEGVGGDCANCIADRPFLGNLKCKLDGREYNDGDIWRPNECRSCSCKGGQISCNYTCNKCSIEGAVYNHGQNWTSLNNSCVHCSCNDGKSECHTQQCGKLPRCKYGIIKLPGKCCPICRETQCERQGKSFMCGCRRRCTDLDHHSPCSGGCRLGCYCPPGSVENIDGKCVNPKNCTCIRDGVTYKIRSETLITKPNRSEKLSVGSLWIHLSNFNAPLFIVC